MIREEETFWATRILEGLRKEFGDPERNDISDPFETLIQTVLSQHTNDRNSGLAYQQLEASFRIKPEVLAEADQKEIERAIRVAGLYRNKSKIIRALSKTIQDRYEGDLWKVLRLPVEEARKALLELPGVGFKTADILLLFCARKASFPVDTHVDRVSRRIGLAGKEVDVEGVRRELQRKFRAEDYYRAHILLINLGKRYCIARLPRCHKCPIEGLCRYGNKTRNGARSRKQSPW